MLNLLCAATDLSILNSVHNSNSNRIKKIGDKIINKVDGGSLICFLGLSFKPNTDDIRDSTSIKIANYLYDKGYKINCYDPKAMDNSKNEFQNYNYFNNSYDACKNVDAIVIGTEWNEFRALNFDEIGNIVKKRKIFDLRNIYNQIELEKKDFEYYATGK